MISVIVPLYNAEKYVEKALISILSQSYTDIEVIVVNDGSTDNSISIVSRFSRTDPRVKVISQNNAGLSSARNTGLKHASGDLIMFADPDDELEPEAICKLHSAITERNSDAAVGSIFVVYEANFELEESDKYYYKIRHNGEYQITDELIDSFHCSTCGVIFKKSIIDQNDLKFPVGLVYEDAFWHWAYFSSCKNVAFIPDYVYRYYRHAKSIMSSTFSLRPGVAIQHLWIAERIFDFLLKNKTLEGRDQRYMLKLLEDHFWASFRYSPNYEKALTVYECARIIRKFSFKLRSGSTLDRIARGDINFLFSTSMDEADHANYLRYLKVKSLVDKILPVGSTRRTVVYSVCRYVYKLLSVKL